MKVSLLVSNFGRANLFRKSLESILPQLKDGDEIVVADDSAFDEGMLPLLKETGVDFQYKFLGNQGYRSGVFAKNVALKMAKNEAIVINDPEVFHLSPCIDQIRDHLKRDARVFVNAGTMYFCQHPRSLDAIKPGQTVLDAARCAMSGITPMKESLAPFVAGVMKVELMAVGGWDERFRYWGNDDNDLMYRLRLNGVTHLTESTMIALHQWHDRPPQAALGDYNEPILYEENKKMVANEGKEWGVI